MVTVLLFYMSFPMLQTPSSQVPGLKVQYTVPEIDESGSSSADRGSAPARRSAAVLPPTVEAGSGRKPPGAAFSPRHTHLLRFRS